nr:hypothetical protein [uncultured Campylobacter sp.]
MLGTIGVVGKDLVRGLCDGSDYDEVEAWAHRQTDFYRFKFCMRIIDFDGI